MSIGIIFFQQYSFSGDSVGLVVACYGAVKGRFKGCVGKEQRERRPGGEWEEWKSTVRARIPNIRIPNPFENGMFQRKFCFRMVLFSNVRNHRYETQNRTFENRTFQNGRVSLGRFIYKKYGHLKINLKVYKVSINIFFIYVWNGLGQLSSVFEWLGPEPNSY